MNKQDLINVAKELYTMRPFDKCREDAILKFRNDCSRFGYNHELIAWRAMVSLKIDSKQQAMELKK